MTSLPVLVFGHEYKIKAFNDASYTFCQWKGDHFLEHGTNTRYYHPPVDVESMEHLIDRSEGRPRG